MRKNASEVTGKWQIKWNFQIMGIYFQFILHIYHFHCLLEYQA